jgi:hypothetical protein
MTEQTPPQATAGRCPASGEPVGRMIEYPGTDEWTIQCPTCGTTWGGGSIVPTERDWPR